MQRLSAFFCFFLVASLQASFLKIGEGARPLSLGGAFVGLADDLSSLYWNPAGLANLRERSLLFGYNSLDNGISSCSFSFSQPISYLSTAGFSLTSLSVSHIEKRATQQDEPDGELEAGNLLVKAGIGRRLNPSISYGGSLSYIRETLAGFKAETGSIDLGGLYQKGRIKAGVSLKNLGGKLKFIKEGSELPTSLSFGLAFAPKDKWYLLSAVERVTSEEKAKIMLGAEYLFRDSISLRLGAGYKNELTPSFGAGIRARNWRIDYAFLPFDIAQTHRISLVSQEKKEPEELTIEELKLNDIFPSKSMFYTKNPVGRMVIFNGLKEPVLVKVSLTIPKVMEYSYSLKEVEVSEKQRVEIPLYASLKNEVLAQIDENMPLQAKVSLEIKRGKQKEEKSFVLPLLLLNKNAIDWNEPKSVSAFVTPNDSLVKSFSRQIVGIGGEFPRIRRVCEIFSGLQLYGIGFVSDPKTSGGLDLVQYPRETLAYKSGDCDDLSTLYASCLESIGISTAFLSVPGHILLLFDTGLTQKNSYLLPKNYEYLLIKDAIFLPLETTRPGFTAALKEGMKELSVWKDTACVIVVSDAWKDYPSFGLPQKDLELILPDKEKVREATDTEMEGFLKDREGSFREEIERLKQANEPNRLGRLYLAMDELSLARIEFMKAKNYVNSGNILLLEGDIYAGLSSYAIALSQNPNDLGVILNIGIACSLKGKLYEAEEAFLSAMKLYPKISEMEKDLGFEILSSGKGEEEGILTRIKSALFKAKERFVKTFSEKEAKDTGLITSGVREIKGEGMESKEILKLILYWGL
ncbi:MAG: PorV/PorQ family protein [bacterium]